VTEEVEKGMRSALDEFNKSFFATLGS